MRGNIVIEHQTPHKNWKWLLFSAVFYLSILLCAWTETKNQMSHFTLIEWHKMKAATIKSMHAVVLKYCYRQFVRNSLPNAIFFEIPFHIICILDRLSFGWSFFFCFSCFLGHLIHTRLSWIFFIYCSGRLVIHATTSNANEQRIRKENRRIFFMNTTPKTNGKENPHETLFFRNKFGAS